MSLSLSCDFWKKQADIENLGNFGLKILGILKAVLVGENPR